MPEQVLKFYLFDIVSLINSIQPQLKSQDKMSLRGSKGQEWGESSLLKYLYLYISSFILATSYITW